jgi:hypothetical protein
MNFVTITSLVVALTLTSILKADASEFTCGGSESKTFCLQVFPNNSYTHSVADEFPKDGLISMVIVRPRRNETYKVHDWYFDFSPGIKGLDGMISFVSCHQHEANLTIQLMKDKANGQYKVGNVKVDSGAGLKSLPDKEKNNIFTIITNNTKHSLVFKTSATLDQMLHRHLYYESWRISVAMTYTRDTSGSKHLNLVTQEAAMFKPMNETSVLRYGTFRNATHLLCDHHHQTNTTVTNDKVPVDPVIIAALCVFIVFLLIAIAGVAYALLKPKK